MRRAPSFLGPSAVLTRFSWALGVELVKINHYKAPRDKLICILNCCKVIFGPPCSPFSFYCLFFVFFSGLPSSLYHFLNGIPSVVVRFLRLISFVGAFFFFFFSAYCVCA